MFWGATCTFQAPRCRTVGCHTQHLGRQLHRSLYNAPSALCRRATPSDPPPISPPRSSRTTAFGFLNALCKLAAVLGISIFTSFVGITKAVPILLASAALALGSSLALKLPETRGQVLQ